LRIGRNINKILVANMVIALSVQECFPHYERVKKIVYDIILYPVWKVE
jgi:hypothetical protein